MRKIGLDIVTLSHSVTQSNNYAVILGEQNGDRRLPIVIGSFEAQAIAVALEQMVPSRPLTHDLFKNTLETFNIDLKEVLINNLLDGIFYAKLICIKDGEVLEIDSRTSDALALAVRFECPIYTYEFILESAGILLDDMEGEPSEQEPVRKQPRPARQEVDSLAAYSEDALDKLLEEVLANEDYEKAAQIRDEMNRRKSQ
ncbi:MAG: bifunctional nuclease family protein [Saprospiraceae bacterium]|nr:bifunctional nuclease family protein [Saprospiraceae bacterium]MCB9323564.1 bifunctional nuclease family protein [Lewinellaceae bacterium]